MGVFPLRVRLLGRSFATVSRGRIWDVGPSYSQGRAAAGGNFAVAKRRITIENHNSFRGVLAQLVEHLNGIEEVRIEPPRLQDFFATNPRHLSVIEMRMFRLVFVLGIFAIVVPIASASDNTIAVWSDGHTSALSDEELIRYALASPGPAFPEEAQKAKMTGSGVYELHINKAGVTTSVVIVKSSGKAVLDKAATTTFRSWRFRPGVFTGVRVPVSWAVNRVH